ncbi:MAG TPA: hypothetical protein VIJ39_00590 [Solirubrobacteraceae bacterium]
MVARRSIAATVALLCASCVLVLVGAQAAWAVEPPAVEEEYVSNVSGTSATLQATVNPRGSTVTYRFEYGTSSSYGASVPQGEGEIAAGAVGVAVSVHIQSLDPSTIYHYRVVATGPGGSADGPDLTFTTQTAGGELVLPDARQWELVSPPNKHGSLIEAGREEGGAIQAAVEGGAIAYYASAPVTAEPAGSRSPEPVDVLSKRTTNGWTTQDLTPPDNEASGVATGYGTEYRAFSSDLSLGLVEALQNLPLSPEATEWTPYLHDNASGSYRPLVSASNVPLGTKFGNFQNRFGQLKFEGASSDFSHVVLDSEVPLTENAVGPGLYEWFEGRLQLISVLPGAEDKPASGEGSALYVGDGQFGRGRRIHAVSTDGTRVVFVGIDPESKERHLYLRDIALGQTVQLDVGGENGGAQFWAASADDSKIIFTDASELTPGSTGGNLYQCEVRVLAGQLTCEVSDLSLGEGVGGVIDASEDGAYMYFVAKNEEIYLAHGGRTSLVGETGPLPAAYFGDPRELTARVSPNGRYLAFLSTRSLTGYDNRDAVSGERDTEMYLYDADSGHLSCASCNPTGARPIGLHISAGGATPDGNTPMMNRSGTFGGQDWWVSGSVPGWTTIGTGGASIYQSRYLANSGRLYFDSPEALVPQDVNGLEDVYEYEPEGVGSCAQERGCVSLITSGSSQEESVFLDASENGDDVFFATAQPLVARDTDHAIDMYDAHVCSADAPCVSEPVLPPPCDSGDSCKAAPSLQPETFGAPPSATFNGQGNLATVEVKSVKVSPKQKSKNASKACEVKYRHNRRRRELCKQRVRSARAKRGRHAAVERRNVKASTKGGGR